MLYVGPGQPKLFLLKKNFSKFLPSGGKKKYILPRICEDCVETGQMKTKQSRLSPENIRYIPSDYPFHCAVPR